MRVLCVILAVLLLPISCANLNTGVLRSTVPVAALEALCGYWQRSSVDHEEIYFVVPETQPVYQFTALYFVSSPRGTKTPEELDEIEEQARRNAKALENLPVHLPEDSDCNFFPRTQPLPSHSGRLVLSLSPVVENPHEAGEVGIFAELDWGLGSFGNDWYWVSWRGSSQDSDMTITELPISEL